MRVRIWSVLAMLSIAGCGGGGGSGGGAAPSGVSVSAPSNLSYSPPQPFGVSRPITAMSPTVTGTVTGYSVSPALPVGLTIDAVTGTISGTPTTPTPSADYTVTASNSAGSTMARITMTVTDTPPAVGYGSTSYKFTTGVPVPTIVPTNTGGLASTWSIDRALPAGLHFETTDGSISGVPSAPSAAETYTITAHNSGGTHTFELSIAVESGVLLDLGHSTHIVAVRREGNRILSIDTSGHWVLWDAAAAVNLARGNVTCPTNSSPCSIRVALAGSTLAVHAGSVVELRDASDGHVLTTISAAEGWWKLASDGSYLATGDATSASAWTRTGASLFSLPGNYASGQAFAAPAELRIAAGAAGVNQLEVIAVPSGTSTTSAYSGTFHSWFDDGGHFFTNVSNTVWVYDAAGVQRDLQTFTSIAKLGGSGRWFWIAPSNSLYMYEVGPGATPDATFAVAPLDAIVPSGNTLAILRFHVPDLSIIDLSGTTPTKVDRTAPLIANTAYATGAGGEWLLGTDLGVLSANDGTPGNTRYFGYGAAMSIAANSQRIAVATARGDILYFDGATRQLEGTIDFASSKVSLSADGTVLAAMATDYYLQYLTDRTLRVFSLPTETVIRNEPYQFNVDPWLRDFSLSESGTVLGRVMETSGNNRVVYPVNGGPIIWQERLTLPISERVPPIYLSPDGRSIAVSNGVTATAATNIIRDGVLIGAVSGVAAGWIDNNRLLANIYTGGGPALRYSHSVIADGTGQQLRTLTLANMSRMQTVDTDRIYSPELNTIFSLSDGQKLWESANPVPWPASLRQGGITATHVIFASGAEVRSEPY